jgi:hypothetical protein
VVRFLLRPRWLAGLGLVVLVAASRSRASAYGSCIGMDERRAYEALVASRLAAAPVPLEDLAGGTDADAMRYRRVTASGTYDTPTR